MFSIVAVPIYIPSNNVQRFPSLYILTNTYFLSFDNSHLNRCDVKLYLIVV